MSAFINTVDIIGEEAMMQALIDKSLTEFADDKLTRIRWNGLSDHTHLVSVNLPSVVDVGVGAFIRCTSLTNVELPAATCIWQTAFALSGVKTLTFPSAIVIAYGGLQNAKNLVTVDLPVVKLINAYSFSGDVLLETVIIRSPEICTLVNTNAFNNTLIASGTGYIYVPSALIEEYKVATNWSTYASQFRAIEDYPDIVTSDVAGRIMPVSVDNIHLPDISTSGANHGSFLSAMNGVWTAVDLSEVKELINETVDARDNFSGNITIPSDSTLMLTDSAGAKWKLIVNTDGTLSTEVIIE